MVSHRQVTHSGDEGVVTRRVQLVGVRSRVIREAIGTNWIINAGCTTIPPIAQGAIMTTFFFLDLQINRVIIAINFFHD